MQIQLKLFASLRDCLPDPNKSILDIDVDSEIAISDLIERYNIPADSVHLVLINGVYVTPEDFSKTQMKEGDVVAMWPPIAGG